MSDVEKRIKELSDRIEAVQSKQYGLNNELQTLHNELLDLKILLRNQTVPGTEQAGAVLFKPNAEPEEIVLQKPETFPPRNPVQKPKVVPNHKLEDFIGTNIISKVGILITIVGIFIGTKYAIDKELISPAMRIVLGYGAATGLILTAIRLKTKYDNFSAVLMGGGLAVLYFITYISYGFYGLFPQTISFLIMVAITVSAVFISLWYNQKIIAILSALAFFIYRSHKYHISLKNVRYNAKKKTTGIIILKNVLSNEPELINILEDSQLI